MINLPTVEEYEREIGPIQGNNPCGCHITQPPCRMCEAGFTTLWHEYQGGIDLPDTPDDIEPRDPFDPRNWGIA